MLVTLEEAKRELDQRFDHAEFDLDNFRIRGPGLSALDCERIESALKCALPRSYRDVASRIDFGHLTLGAMQFGSGRLGQADELIAQNTKESWWGAGDRPRDLIRIGNGDPYVALLRLSDGTILAFENDWKAACVVASDILLFIRGLVTAYLLHEGHFVAPADADILVKSVGGDDREFWRRALV